ncbi:hypothetical protein GCM10018772_21640 [Streptomyces fumanus]|uniref:Uncharacterized protein n=1 Tax=Streptomyces fumanus TaxID=67302 RepID=A0A919ABD2_9ACTN|nr:hypothetical protein GCM10018772_21640 [Streptomyces fumanus]
MPLDHPDDLDVPEHHALHTLVLVHHATDLRTGRTIVSMRILLKEIRIHLIAHTADTLGGWMW